jgi:peptide/nickel transport system substrate-binding protein
MLYVRHPEYYEKDRPYLDAVNIRLIPQRDVIVAAFRTKQLDMTQYAEYEDVQDMVKKNPKMQWMEYFSNSWPRLTFAVDKPPFNDKRLRQAVSMSIDRQQMLDIQFDGRGRVDRVYPMWQWGSLPVDKLGKASKNFRLNIEEAKRLVKAAGYKVPLKINMAFTPAYGTVWVSLTETLIGLLNNSGVFQVKLKSKEYGAYISSNYLGKYKDDCFYGYTTPPGDPDEALWDLHYSTSARNSARVNDPHLDKLLEAQRRELNKEKRLAILHEIQYYLGDQIYHMPTVSQPGYRIWYPHVKGYAYHLIPAYNVGDRDRLVWIDK